MKYYYRINMQDLDKGPFLESFNDGSNADSCETEKVKKKNNCNEIVKKYWGLLYKIIHLVLKFGILLILGYVVKILNKFNVFELPSLPLLVLILANIVVVLGPIIALVLKTKQAKDKTISKIKFKILIYVYAAIAIACMWYFERTKLNVSTSLTNLFWFIIITYYFVYLSVETKGNFISKVLFSYKYDLMNLYYQCLNKEYKIEKLSWDNQINWKNINDIEKKEIEEVIIPVTYNGALIGIIEGFLIVIGILVKMPSFIGIVLAVRSYVAVASHPNKEESEFYIIGTLGSLLFTIVLTFLYVLVLDCFTGINLFTDIPTILGKIT